MSHRCIGFGSIAPLLLVLAFLWDLTIPNGQCSGTITLPFPLDRATDIALDATWSWIPPDGATSFSLSLRQVCLRPFAAHDWIIAPDILNLRDTRLATTDLYLMDLEGDGDLDLVGDGGSALFSILNEGGGAFSLPFMEESANQEVGMVDIDGDGFPDFLDASYETVWTVYWRRNDGRGGFGARTALFTSPVYEVGGYLFQAIDLDQDGYGDVLERKGNIPLPGTDLKYEATWLHRNLGDGSFESIRIGDERVIAIFDANSDGLLDLVLESRRPYTDPNPEILRIYLLLNLGGGQFQTSTLVELQESSRAYTPQTWYELPAFADYDGDGDVDLLLQKKEEAYMHIWPTTTTLLLFENTGGLVLSEPVTLAVGGKEDTYLLVDDSDHDGKTEILARWGSSAWGGYWLYPDIDAYEGQKLLWVEESDLGQSRFSTVYDGDLTSLYVEDSTSLGSVSLLADREKSRLLWWEEIPGLDHREFQPFLVEQRQKEWTRKLLERGTSVPWQGNQYYEDISGDGGKDIITGGTLYGPTWSENLSFTADFQTTQPLFQRRVPLKPGLLYEWQVTAYGADGVTTGPWWSFTTAGEIDATPELASPSDGTVDVDLREPVVLQWEETPGAYWYDLYLWRDGESRPDQPTFTTLTLTSVDVTDQLDWLTGYHWQVVAHNYADSMESPEYEFITLENLPYPPNGSVDLPALFTFRWNPNDFLANPDRYEITLRRQDQAPGEAVVFTGFATPSYTLTQPLEYGTTYVWTLKAYRNGFSSGGAERAFTTMAQPQASKWLDGMGVDDGWRLPDHPRCLADVNGDGLDDVVGFADRGVMVALSSGDGFSTPSMWTPGFGFEAGWRPDRHPRFVADVSGDGRADLIGFGDRGITVAVSAGSAFGAPSMWTRGFGYEAFWRSESHPRLLGDVNGDGRMDAVGFGDRGVTVATSNGAGFDAPALWTVGFGREAGWSVNDHPRILGDVNGDGMDDVLGFGDRGVTVALSNGSGFDTPALWVLGYGRNDGWDTTKHVRALADIDGDGAEDVVAFGHAGVMVSLAQDDSFTTPALWSTGFGYKNGWRVESHPRLVRDLNGDGKADLIGFGNEGTYIALSTGVGFAPVSLWIDVFGADDGWRTDQHPRLAGHADSDPILDIAGFWNTGILVY